MVREPEVSGFRINLQKKQEINIEKLINLLSIFKNYSIAKTENGISILCVEGRDINKKPYKFYIMNLKEKILEVLYSSPMEDNPKYRRLEVYKHCLDLLRLLSDFYSVSTDELVLITSKFLKELKVTLTDDYTNLYNQYEFLEKKCEYLNERLASIEKSNEANIRNNYRLKQENNDLKIKLNALEKYSDENLETKIDKWLREHNGEIDLTEFANIYSISETRIEQILNKLVKTGNITPRD